jgi:hypothetical protein
LIGKSANPLFSIFDRRLQTEVCAEQRRMHELRHRMRLLTANDIEDENDDEDEDDRRGLVNRGLRRAKTDARMTAPDAFTHCQ